MNEAAMPRSATQNEDNLRLLTHLLYALHTVSWFTAGILSVVAIVINYVKRPALPSDLYRSHFRWQARTFWFTLLWLLLTAPLYAFFWFPGAFAWCAIGLWYLYRCVRGWWTFFDGRPMPLPAN